MNKFLCANQEALDLFKILIVGIKIRGVLYLLNIGPGNQHVSDAHKFMIHSSMNSRKVI